MSVGKWVSAFEQYGKNVIRTLMVSSMDFFRTYCKLYKDEFNQKVYPHNMGIRQCLKLIYMYRMGENKGEEFSIFLKKTDIES